MRIKSITSLTLYTALYHLSVAGARIRNNLHSNIA